MDMDPDLRGVLEWSDPPPEGHGGPGKPGGRVWAIVARDLRSRPGIYGLIDVGGNPSIATHISRGKTRLWAPPGSYEATTRFIDGQVHVWARYVGEPGAAGDGESG